MNGAQTASISSACSVEVGAAGRRRAGRYVDHARRRPRAGPRPRAGRSSGTPSRGSAARRRRCARRSPGSPGSRSAGRRRAPRGSRRGRRRGVPADPRDLLLLGEAEQPGQPGGRSASAGWAVPSRPTRPTAPPRAPRPHVHQRTAAWPPFRCCWKSDSNSRPQSRFPILLPPCRTSVRTFCERIVRTIAIYRDSTRVETPRDKRPSRARCDLGPTVGAMTDWAEVYRVNVDAVTDLAEGLIDRAAVDPGARRPPTGRARRARAPRRLAGRRAERPDGRRALRRSWTGGHVGERAARTVEELVAEIRGSVDDVWRRSTATTAARWCGTRCPPRRPARGARPRGAARADVAAGARGDDASARRARRGLGRAYRTTSCSGRSSPVGRGRRPPRWGTRPRPGDARRICLFGPRDDDQPMPEQGRSDPA